MQLPESKYDPLAAFRLPRRLLATVESVCEQQDLTKSQIFRHSIVEYLKNRNIGIIGDVKPPEPQSQWHPELYERMQRRR